MPVTSPDRPAGETGAVSRADIDQACHRIIRRMRGAPRTKARSQGSGRLAIRHTLRAALKTDGDPVHLYRRTRVPGRIRLLIVADVSLSVRPVAGFILRMAQALHDISDRCTVLAFVDDPVDVTTPLLVGHGDHALTRVLSAPGLDLAATSDYGQVLEKLLTTHGVCWTAGPASCSSAMRVVTGSPQSQNYWKNCGVEPTGWHGSLRSRAGTGIRRGAG